ncbi:MAG: hypothetical protein NT074_06060 [Methanomicrobiales archaeon]|nr:hypothetical protein [Methanomicrobiales archaeon]
MRKGIPLLEPYQVTVIAVVSLHDGVNDVPAFLSSCGGEGCEDGEV